MARVFKFTDFEVSDYGMILDGDSNVKDTIGDYFYVSYFGGSYKEKFNFARALTTDKYVEYLYRSQNGNRAIVKMGLTQ